MEEFYQEIYAVDGIRDIQFPQHYPVSRLIGCVEVVGCVSCDELQNWEALSPGVRLEGQTDFCWLCEKPQKLIIPFEMRGYQGVYNLENKIHVAAARGLTPPSQSPYAVKFLLPDPKDPFSLKPGSISSTIQEKKAAETEETTTTLTAAIAGARAAATQFSKKAQSPQTGDYVTRSKSKGIEGCSGSSSKVEDDTKLTVESDKTSVATKREERNISAGQRRFDPGTARILAAAIRNLKPSS
jgi:hypothetical protein